MLLTQLSMGMSQSLQTSKYGAQKMYSFVIAALVLGIFFFQISDCITIGDMSFASRDNLTSSYSIAFLAQFVHSTVVYPFDEKV